MVMVMMMNMYIQSITNVGACILHRREWEPVLSCLVMFYQGGGGGLLDRGCILLMCIEFRVDYMYFMVFGGIIRTSCTSLCVSRLSWALWLHMIMGLFLLPFLPTG